MFTVNIANYLKLKNLSLIRSYKTFFIGGATMHDLSKDDFLITRKETALLLGVCLNTLDKIEDLPKIRIGSAVKYHTGTVKEWIKKHNQLEEAQE